MHLIYLGCVITNFFAFQEFLNYPLNYLQVSTAYYKALNKDMQIMKRRETSRLNLAYFPEALELLYPSTTAQILWVNKDDYPKEMCDKLSELEALPDLEPRFTYASIRRLRGCPLPNGELHKEICRYINHFDPMELRLKAIDMMLIDANIKTPKCETTCKFCYEEEEGRGGEEGRDADEDYGDYDIM